MTAVLGDNSIKGTRMGLFEPGSDALKAARNRCSNAIAAFHALPEDAPAEQRGEIVYPSSADAHAADLNSQNSKCTAPGPLVETPIHIDYGTRVRIAPTAFIDRNCFILDNPMADITIGSHVCIGPNVMIVSASHSNITAVNGKRMSFGNQVTICDRSWIGAGAIIRPGVTIGMDSIVAAGSVVTKDVRTNCMVGGIPARVLEADLTVPSVSRDPQNIMTTLTTAAKFGKIFLDAETADRVVAVMMAVQAEDGYEGMP